MTVEPEPGIFEIMYSTRAMRKLKSDPIPEETLKKIIDAGIRAPSGGNMQDWAFLLVRETERKRFIRDYYWNTWQAMMGESGIPDEMPAKQQRMLKAAAHLAAHMDEAPVLLLACTKTEYPPLAAMKNDRANAAVIHGTIYPAVQNILLACRASGIGATLTTIHCMFEEELKKKFNIPADMEVSALIPMGYPQGKFGPVSRGPVDDVIHWDEWSGGQG